jgi:hypothetical protein
MLSGCPAPSSRSALEQMDETNHPVEASDDDDKAVTVTRSAMAVASTSPEAAAAVPKAMAEAVVVPEPPPVTAIGPDTGAILYARRPLVRRLIGTRSAIWRKTGRRVPSPRVPTQCLLCQAGATLGAEVLSLHSLVARSFLVARPPRSCFWSCAE